MKRSLARVLPLVALSTVVLAGCGSDLTSNDEKVCAAAVDEDAEGVYGTADVADDEEIAREAARIKIGTSSKSDDDAMAQIAQRCQDMGYEAPAEDA